MTVLVHRHYYNPVDKAILWTFWMQFLYQIEVFIDKFSLYSLNLSPEDKKYNFRFWVLVPTIGTVH